MNISVREIAEFLGAHVKGDENLLISGFASLDRAQPHDLTFLADKKYLPALESSRSQVVLVSQDIETDKTLLITENPKLSFARLLEKETRPQDIKPGVDARAWVEEGAHVSKTAVIYPFVTVRRGAQIGENVILYPGVYVGEKAVIGDHSILYPHVSVYAETNIGKRVIIHAGTVLGSDGFGYVWDGEKHFKFPPVGSLIIDNDVEIGANSALDRGALNETSIGEGTKIDNLVQVGHNSHIGKFCILCGQVGMAGRVQVGDGSVLAGQVGIADGLRIGSGAKIAGQSGVTKNIEDQKTVFGTPAMDFNDYMKIVALWKKLPKMAKELRELRNELEELKK
ncbi:MAG: UDP-3-O-(3-hydroxymyristoyl)glucosamine N-acyltransferase [Deltaproteobacteria bacterium]|nr:UDP-3-O-(3-hydroxymyristoyl)glucosamine N-acyltransferase [Deltaproteobacteria bacterium]